LLGSNPMSHQRMASARQQHIARKTGLNVLQSVVHSKHAFGLERTVLDGIDGASTCCGWGVLAHNSVKIATLVEENNDKSAQRQACRPPAQPPSTGPATGRSPTGPDCRLTGPRPCRLHSSRPASLNGGGECGS
jgi:hypothetical protein